MCSSGSESLLGDRLVQFRVLAAGFEENLFSSATRKIADKSRGLLELHSDRDHPHACRDPLHISRNARQLGQIALEYRILDRCKNRAVANQGLRDHHFSDHVHKLIQLGGFDADRFGVAGMTSLPLRLDRQARLRVR